ncbi:MAG: hypothetical protein EXX96DRAFT_583154 [Benjaminiella poitrasii]|nr:MAG: hypothetical protein EXX96DRAFT_583154 [Benjaminiella poitrasii]
MEQKSHIITEQVFGSSRKIQFIGLTTTTAATPQRPSSSMDSLLSAIDQVQSNTAYNDNRRSDINRNTTNNNRHRLLSSSSAAHQPMSIESLLASNSDSGTVQQPQHNQQQQFDDSAFDHPRLSQTASTNEISIASLLTSDTVSKSYKRRWNEEDHKHAKRTHHKKSIHKQRATITCLHASVAQKSYGSEKRFLCPPPIVYLNPPSNSSLTNEQRSERMQLSMSVICENSGKLLEQHSALDENQSGSFKYLHVTGTAKAKQFHLKVDLLPTSSEDPSSSQPFASFISKPISIISKPSKKTAKTRNVSACILANSPISLFNRINSQTVRTKYMTSSDDMLCAKNTTWSPFDIIVVSQPKLPQPHKSTSTITHNRFTCRLQLPHPSSDLNQQSTAKSPLHITYGTEIMLRDTQTGVTSPSLIIRKVDKGRIVQCAYGPVSQMQKVALQLASTAHTRPVYLSASGSITDSSSSSSSSSSSTFHGESDTTTNSNNNCTWLDYSPSRLVQSEKLSLELDYEEVDDYLCWTIVGIKKFEYDYDESIENAIQQQQKVIERSEDSESSSAEPSSNNRTTSSPVTPEPLSPRHITPLPLLTTIDYRHESHTLDVTGQHLIQAAPIPRLLDLWLGTHGPLPTRVSQAPQPHKPHETHWSVQLPSTQDLLSATNTTKDKFELTFLLVRQQDGMVYHTGKSLLYSPDTSEQWKVISTCSL